MKVKSFFAATTLAVFTAAGTRHRDISAFTAAGGKFRVLGAESGYGLIDTARIYAGIFRKERLSFRAVRNRLIFVKTLTFSILH